MELAYEQKYEIQSSLDKILTAKYIWDKKGIHLNKKWYFYENNREIFSQEFFINTLSLVLNTEKISCEELEKYDMYRVLFPWPVWKRLSQEFELLNEEEKLTVEAIFEASSDVSLFSLMDMVSDANLTFGMDGMVSLMIHEYSYCSPLIQSILDTDRKFHELEEKVTARKLSKSLVLECTR